MYIEYIGYLASVCIVLSFIMKKVQHIRLINLIGCLCPVIIPNALICFVQIYYLSKSKK